MSNGSEKHICLIRADGVSSVLWKCHSKTMLPWGGKRRAWSPGAKLCLPFSSTQTCVELLTRSFCVCMWAHTLVLPYMLRIYSGPLCMLSKHFTREIHPHSHNYFLVNLDSGIWSQTYVYQQLQRMDEVSCKGLGTCSEVTCLPYKYEDQS